jgi:hypothetical protein
MINMVIYQNVILDPTEMNWFTTYLAVRLGGSHPIADWDEVIYYVSCGPFVSVLPYRWLRSLIYHVSCSPLCGSHPITGWVEMIHYVSCGPFMWVLFFRRLRWIDLLRILRSVCVGPILSPTEMKWFTTYISVRLCGPHPIADWDEMISSVCVGPILSPSEIKWFSPFVAVLLCGSHPIAEWDEMIYYVSCGPFVWVLSYRRLRWRDARSTHLYWGEIQNKKYLNLQYFVLHNEI